MKNAEKMQKNRKNISDNSHKSYKSLQRIYIRIGTWNVRTLLQVASLELLTREMDRSTVQLLGISEMRWTGKGHFTTSDGHTVYFSGNEKGGKKGVAFIANQHTAKRVLGYNPSMTG